MSLAEETRHGEAVQAREGGGGQPLSERAGRPPSPLATFGWQTQIGSFVAPKGVIGIVVAQTFPDTALIVAKLEEGIVRAHPDTVWVMRDGERRGHAANAAWAVFREHGIEPIQAPLVPTWRVRNGCEYVSERGKKRQKLVWTYNDLRAKWRDAEMRNACERIVVFHDKKSGITADWIDFAVSRKKHPGDGSHCVAQVYVVERGTKRKVARKGRKPTE